MEISELRAELTRYEGEKLKPYKDTVGKLTIGVGRNLDDVGITAEESALLLTNDIRRVVKELNAAVPWWRRMPEPAQRALCNMAFNLGLPRLLEFENMLEALQAGNYKLAAKEALDSKWAKQVKARAKRIAGMYREAEKLRA